jgi:predicted metal-dependent phosphoesterase TrpH
MKAFKYELHAHTVEVSSCAYENARDMVNFYKKKGFQGIVITDHFHEEYFNSLGNMKWEDKIDLYHTGFKEAFDEGKKLGMDIFQGIELRFTDHANDYLVYGLDDTFLKSHENMHEYTLSDFFNIVRDNEQILIYQAHPYRPGHSIANPDLLDGLEIYNGNPRHNSRNDKARAFAREHQLLFLSGSDFHQAGDEASGGIITKKRITCPVELIHTLKNLNFESLLEEK